MDATDLSRWFLRKVFLPVFREIFPDLILAHEKEFKPCPHLPGSASKIRALAHRVRLRLPLWHPEDRQLGLRDVLLFKAIGGDHVAAAVAKEVPPQEAPEGERLQILEICEHQKRRRSQAELAQRSTPQYKAAEAARRREERRRKRASKGAA